MENVTVELSEEQLKHIEKIVARAVKKFA